MNCRPSCEVYYRPVHQVVHFDSPLFQRTQNKALPKVTQAPVFETELGTGRVQHKQTHIGNTTHKNGAHRRSGLTHPLHLQDKHHKRNKYHKRSGKRKRGVSERWTGPTAPSDAGKKERRRQDTSIWFLVFLFPPTRMYVHTSGYSTTVTPSGNSLISRPEGRMYLRVPSGKSISFSPVL